MANHVTSILTAENIEDMDIFTPSPWGEGIDFQKIIPRPASLDVVSGSTNGFAIMCYVTECATNPIDILTGDRKSILDQFVTNMFDDNWQTQTFNRVLKDRCRPWSSNMVYMVCGKLGYQVEC